MIPFNAVIFDLDGVVIDSIKTIEAAFTAAYREVIGDDTPPFDEFRRHFGMSFPVIMERMGLPAAMHAPFIRESNARIDGVHIHPGMVELLADLQRAGVYCGVATGKDGRRARHVLQRLGLLASFKLVLGSDDVASPKPAPDMALRHLQQARVPPPEAIMIGDSVADIHCGRAAGILVGAALWGETDPEVLLAEKPDHVLCSPADLHGLLLPDETVARKRSRAVQ